MRDFFLNLYASVRNRHSFLAKIKFYALERFAISVLGNMFIPFCFRCTQSNPSYRLEPLHSTSAKQRIIVSMTSFSKRIGKVWIVIESLLRQSHKPDAIILWLSEDEFPDMASLPSRLLKLQKRGLKIELRPGNLMSHKKYHYFLKEYPHDHLITVDDDIIYPSDFISSLLKYHQKYPDCIIARFAYLISYDKSGKLLPYNDWPLLMKESEPSPFVFFGSGGGTLMPAYSLGIEAQNINLALEKCKYADDVWLNTMCRLNKTKVILIPHRFSFFPVLNFRNSKLVTLNNGKSLNDVQIKALREYYDQHKHIDPYHKNYLSDNYL